MNIRKHNIPAHIDIENDIKAKVSGLLTFTLRINAGNITDYNRPETIDPAAKYPNTERDPLEQFTISPDLGKRSRGNSIRDDNGDADGGGRKGGHEPIKSSVDAEKEVSGGRA